MQYLFENKTISSQEELCKYIQNNTSLHTYFENSFKGVKPKNYCGFLSIANENYFIIPKIIEHQQAHNLNIFIYMLMYAYDIKLSNEDMMKAQMQEHHIFEVFIRFFADCLLEEFKRGVFRKYVTMQENLKTLRGKYMVEKNFANFYHQNIYCEFDEFSMDNELNRFFLYAIRVFKKFSNYSNLHRCEAVLDEVAYFNVDFKRLNIHFDRVNSRYQKSYEVALLLLQKLVPMTGRGEKKSFAFLFDMAEVFEKFVGRLFKEVDSTTQLQKQGNFGSLVLKPDIMTSEMIIDTKYKLVKNREELMTSDKYQMFAYGRNFDVKETMLLYPKHLVDVSEDLELGKGDEMVRLKMRSLDLRFDDGYYKYIDEIKKRLERMYEKNQ